MLPMQKSYKKIFIAALLTLSLLTGAAVFTHTRALPGITQVSEAVNAEPRELLPEPKDSLHLPILMYHHIGKNQEGSDATQKGLTVSTHAFEEQMEFLKAEGFTTITLGELLAYTERKFKLPAKPIIITFDDGYTDSFENAIPILEAQGFKASFAVITGFTGQTFGLNSYATWEQIKDAQNRGMEIVSHTQNHFDGLNPVHKMEAIYENLKASRQDILEHTGTDTTILIYPYGHYTKDYMSEAKKAGFTLGITTADGTVLDLTKPMELPRVRITPGMDLEKFKKKLGM